MRSEHEQLMRSCDWKRYMPLRWWLCLFGMAFVLGLQLSFTIHILRNL